MISNDGDYSTDSTILCAVCDQDITALELRARTMHTERCLDSSAAQESSQSSSGGMGSCISTLDLLDDCPVCGSAWPAHVASRADHTKRCAKRHGISGKDLVDLVNMFRESLGSTSGTSDSMNRDSQAFSRTPSAEADARGCRAFIKAFSPPSQASTTPLVQQGSARGKKRPLTKKASRDRLLPRPIDGWFDRRSSAEPDNASDKQSTSSKSSQQLALSNGPMSLETDDYDDDFQVTKPRAALTQSRIAVRKVSKKRQEFLDDLDDELNVAKALSLSLKRGPDPAKSGKGVGAKRRDTSAARANALAKSDILASSEAQSLIRQRAAALEKMDEEWDAASLLRVHKNKTAIVDSESQRSDDTSLRLWDMGALSGASGREYCEIFENYKVCRLGHSSSDACLDDTVDRLLMALSLTEQDRFRPGPLDETTLRHGYMCLLRAVHGSFARQAAKLRCAEWVESSEASISGRGNGATANDMNNSDCSSSSSDIIILSSESDLEAEPLTAEPLAVEPLHRVDKSTRRPVSNMLAVAKKHKTAAAIVKAPDYTKLAHAELQSLAEKYGLRTNTPKRLLIHQLQTIWEQTNGRRSGADTVSTSCDLAPERIDDVQLLFSRIRQHIRNNHDLFEQILCYRVLNFDAVYKDVSAAVKCQKSVLRKFFDLEGIVYSSYHD
ncbi:hypothetical protein GGH93_003516 [Coemansia aciculifera]|nr:hypothetical protein GGH93_003516 [Coemansia aciculifera]